MCKTERARQCLFVWLSIRGGCVQLACIVSSPFVAVSEDVWLLCVFVWCAFWNATYFTWQLLIDLLIDSLRLLPSLFGMVWFLGSSTRWQLDRTCYPLNVIICLLIILFLFLVIIKRDESRAEIYDWRRGNDIAGALESRWREKRKHFFQAAVRGMQYTKSLGLFYFWFQMTIYLKLKLVTRFTGIKYNIHFPPSTTF